MSELTDNLIFVDCEASGPCPGKGVLTEFGAVVYRTRSVFHGTLWIVEPSDNPVVPRPIEEVPDSMRVWRTFDEWISREVPDRPVLVSDNPAFDWQWINHGFWHALDRNPFGHSARRIGDFYAGLTDNFKNANHWKRLRVTKHTHNPVDDAMGNVEAFDRMLKGERA